MRVISNQTFYKSSIESINMSHCIIYTLPFGIFAECKKLEEVYLPNCLECIKEKAFFRCESLMSITFPSSIRDIEKKAFQECQSLVELNMSFMKLKTLNDKLFFNCRGLEYIELPNCLQSIGFDVFYQTGITGLIIPPSTTTITEKSFIGMSELIKITLADTQITRIYSTTFSKCFNLFEVQLPTCLEYLEENAFIDCTLLYNLIYCGTSKFSYLKLFSSRPYVTVTIDYPSRTFAGIKVRRSNKCYYMEVFQTIKEDSNKNKKEWSNVLSCNLYF